MIIKSLQRLLTIQHFFLIDIYNFKLGVKISIVLKWKKKSLSFYRTNRLVLVTFHVWPFKRY